MASMHRTPQSHSGAASGTAPAQLAQQLHPRIDISVSASSHMLDLITRTKFSLTITFTLHNSPQPIALFKTSSPLLQPTTALTSPGLAFINAGTGVPVLRHALHSGHPKCSLGQGPYSKNDDDDDDDGTPYSNEKPVTYLQPGVPWSVTHTLGPDVMRQPRVRIGPDGLPERFEGPEEAFWFGTEGLEDGQVYEVRLSEEAGKGVKVFERQGVAWEVFTAPVRAVASGLVGGSLRRYGEGRWVSQEEVPVVLVETAKFEFLGVPEGKDGIRQWP